MATKVMALEWAKYGIRVNAVAPGLVKTRFSQALYSGDWAATFRTGHPGVMTTWLGTLGIGWQRIVLGVPSSAEWSWLLQLSTLDPRDGTALQRLAPLLVGAKIPLTLATALAVVGCWALARRLVDPPAALWGGLLIALDPFFLSLSRVLHLDALLASFMALGLLSLLVYLRYPIQRRWLLVSACATGSAALTKTPAVFLLPVGAILLLAFAEGRSRALLLWGGVILGTYIALWPAMWVTPIETLRSVLDKAFGYAAQAEETAHFFRGTAVADPGPLFYPVAFVFRASPLTLLGLVASALLWRQKPRKSKWVWTVLLTYALLYGLFMALGAKKFDRYLLPLFLPVNLLAAMGWACLSRMITRSKWRTADGRWRMANGRSSLPSVSRMKWMLTGGAALALVQAVLVFPHHPHYLAWYNPLLGGLQRAVRILPVGWGEGLEGAAAYLNAQPDAERLTVASAGVPGMAPKFQGRTLPLDPASLIEADYVVIYVSDRQGGPSPVDGFINGTLPRHVVRLQGVEYAWVYPNESYRAPLQLLASEADASAALLIAGPSLLGKYYDGPSPSYVLRGEESEAEVASVLHDLAAGHQRMWYVDFPVLTSPTADVAQYQLASRAYRARERAFPLATLFLYQLPEEAGFAPGEVQTGVGPFTFGDELRLTRYGLSDPSIGWGQRLGVQLAWQVIAPVKTDYTVFLHLVDHSGHLWGQVDVPLRNEAGKGITSWPAGAEQTIRYLLPPWAGVPPGQYQLLVGVYRPDTQQHLPARDGQGQPVSGPVTLGQVQVIRSPVQPTMDEFSIPNRLERKIGDSILLLGYNLWPSSLQPGTSLHLDLFWRVQAPPGEDYRLFLELGGEVKELAIPSAFYPSSRWRAGEMLRGQFDIPAPADLPPGETSVNIRLVRLDGRYVSTDAIALGPVRVQGRIRSFERPALRHPLDVRLGDRIALLGYDLPDVRIRPGEPLHLTLYWQAQGSTDVAYTVFAHLLGSEGRVLAQKDNPPQGGAAPTTGWLPGEVIADEYWIPTPVELPAGPFQIEVGMYDPATGERLPVFDGQGNRLPGDRALLMSLEGE